MNFYTPCRGFLKQLSAAVIFFVACISAVPAQTKIIDSLKKEITAAGSSTIKLSKIFELCNQYRSMHPDTLQYYVSMAKKIAASSGNPQDIANTEYYSAVLLIRAGKTDSALAVIEKNIQLPDDKNNRQLRNSFSILKCNLLIRNNRQKEAIETGLLLLHIADAQNDAALQVKAKTVIGWAYMELGQNRDALNLSFNAIDTWQKNDTSVYIAVVYSNIAAVYNELNKNDSAEYFIIKAIERAKQEQNLTALTNGYYIYSDICVAGKNKVKAESLLVEGLRIRKQIGDVFYIVSDIAQLGVFYANNNQPRKGIEAVKEGIAIAEQNNLYAKLPFLYAALAKNYKAAGNLAAYSSTLIKIIDLKDSLYRRNNAEALAEMQTKYDVQKKENTIIQQQYDLTKENYFIYASAGLLAATVLIAVAFFKNRQKNQRLKMQQLLLEQKKKTTQAVMQAEEDERKRIALELHDSVAQKMVVAKLNLEAFESDLHNLTSEQKDVYNNIFSLVDESCTEVRELSHSMVPQAFFKSGLTDALKSLTDKIKSKNLHVTLSAAGDLNNLDPNSELMIYRIVQECIQNVLKHAKASRLDIALIAENNELDITIEDNGTGFDASLKSEDGLGMKNLYSRIEYLNGTIDITSTPGKGTAIAMYIPMNRTNES